MRVGTFPLNSCQCHFGFSHFSLVSGEDNPAGKAALAAMDSLAPAPIMLSSVCFKPGGPSPALSGDSPTGSAGLSALDHLRASSNDLKRPFIKLIVVLVMELHRASWLPPWCLSRTASAMILSHRQVWPC